MGESENSKIFRDENGTCELDCTNAVWATDEIHSVYQTVPKLQALNDVDWIIETETHLILVEYENARAQRTRNAEYNPLNILVRLARKYYDSLHYLSVMGKDKPKKYVCVLEWPHGNSRECKKLRNQLLKELPFSLPQRLNKDKRLIDDVDVLSVKKWNEQYPDYPLRLISE